MGLKVCLRRKCDNIMCDIYIPDVGYICGICKKEFKEFLLERKKYPKTEKKITAQLVIFLNTPKDYSRDFDDEITVDEFFDKMTE